MKHSGLGFWLWLLALIPVSCVLMVLVLLDDVFSARGADPKWTRPGKQGWMTFLVNKVADLASWIFSKISL